MSLPRPVLCARTKMDNHLPSSSPPAAKDGGPREPLLQPSRLPGGWADGARATHHGAESHPPSRPPTAGSGPLLSGPTASQKYVGRSLSHFKRLFPKPDHGDHYFLCPLPLSLSLCRGEGWVWKEGGALLVRDRQAGRWGDGCG